MNRKALVRITANEVNRPITDAILGLDVGTSCTKAVIRTPFIGGGRAVAVPLAPTDPILSYLVPTALITKADGTVGIPCRTLVAESWTSPKVALMISPYDLEAKVSLTAYLSTVGQLARDWFIRTQREVFGVNQLRWTWNLGIPSNGCIADNPMKEAFHHCLIVAKNLVESGLQIRLDTVRESLLCHPPDEPDASIVPEVIAEVVGYARSYHREHGLHLIIDVGATTLDVCAFNLTRADGDDGYGILATEVECFGIHELHKVRLGALSKPQNPDLRPGEKQLSPHDFLEPIPASIRDYIAPRSLLHLANSVDLDFAKKCTNQLMKVIHQVRTKRYRESPAWRAGIPTLIGGGGGASGFYRDVLRDASERCRQGYSDVAPLRIRDLPVPPQLDDPGIDSKVFARMAVAHGLSFDRFDIGHVVSPDQIPDEPPPRRREPREMVTNDQL